MLPILLHDNCMALTKCVSNAIRLEVYLDDDSATGMLYADDGVSLLHASHGAFATVKFEWNGTSFTSSLTSEGASYTFPSTQVID